MIRIKWHKRTDTRTYRGHVFQRSLILILLVTIIPTILISVSSYYIGVRYIEREVERTHSLQQEYTIKQVNDALSHLQVSMNQWALNPIMSEKLRGIDFKDNYALTMEFYQSLTVMNNSSALIDQVYVYLENPSRLVSDSQGIRKLSTEETELYRKLMTSKERLFWRSLDAAGKPGMFVIHKLPVIGEPFGAILVRLNEKQLMNIAGFDESLGGTIFIRNLEGYFLSRDHFSPRIKSLNEAIEQEIQTRTELSSFRWSWNNEPFFVSTSTIPLTSWQLVSAVPLSEFVKPIVIVSRLILGVGIVGFILILFSSWYASVRLYQPIHRLVRTFISPSGFEPLLVPKDEITYIEDQWRHLNSESHMLQSRLEAHYSTLKIGFLLQLVQGHLLLLNEDEIRQRLEQYGWETENKRFVVVVVQLLGFQQLKGAFRDDEQPLVTFAAANIIEELTQHDDVCVMNLHDLSVGLFIMFPDRISSSEISNRLNEMAAEIGQSLHRILKMDTVVGLGKTMSSISQVPNAWAEVQQALRHRKLHESNQIIDLNEPMNEDNSAAKYPFTVENDLIHSLFIGLGDDSRRLLNVFFQELKKNSELELFLQQGSLKLLGSIQSSIMQSGIIQAGSLYDWGQLFAELLALKDIDAMCTWFDDKIIQPLITELAHNQNHKARQLIEISIGMIRTEYHTDISLDLCADRLGLAASSLSKMFFQVTGLHFVDYITKVRLDHAKHFLMHSDLKMQEIAVQIGYQPAYFNRIFKKMEGMTPKDFRELHKV
ncbi:Helix-turn-helix domain-containing protein [Paenibacillus sp. 1_12]|uniref:helix-turn-helix domain-containing protein n=1 Tax=Paenibacillus sp. 1_12 TaxID=1566278 RepID=UPI0008E5709E|nr:helix-turn-helix domain-containing protein [Paenibacillus sp. 1_12]SFM08795.1 Helix-turn-helix domain-containing protein [Paenibacillus sp. 1_12]